MIKHTQILLVIQPVAIEVSVRPIRATVVEEFFPRTGGARASSTGMSRIRTGCVVVRRIDQIVSGSQRTMMRRHPFVIIIEFP